MNNKERVSIVPARFIFIRFCDNLEVRCVILAFEDQNTILRFSQVNNFAISDHITIYIYIAHYIILVHFTTRVFRDILFPFKLSFYYFL